MPGLDLERTAWTCTPHRRKGAGRARGAIYVHVGTGSATATHKYWGFSAPLFANPTFDTRAIGDGGYLFDPRGDLRAWMLYPCVTACTGS